MEPTLDDHIGFYRIFAHGNVAATTTRPACDDGQRQQGSACSLVRFTGDGKSWSGTLLPLSSLQ